MPFQQRFSRAYRHREARLLRLPQGHLRVQLEPDREEQLPGHPEREHQAKLP
jgi:hypothetical protein